MQHPVSRGFVVFRKTLVHVCVCVYVSVCMCVCTQDVNSPCFQDKTLTDTRTLGGCYCYSLITQRSTLGKVQNNICSLTVPG